MVPAIRDPPALLRGPQARRRARACTGLHTWEETRRIHKQTASLAEFLRAKQGYATPQVGATVGTPRTWEVLANESVPNAG